MKNNMKKYAGLALASTVIIGGIASAAITPMPTISNTFAVAGQVIKSADLNKLAESINILDKRAFQKDGSEARFNFPFLSNGNARPAGTEVMIWDDGTLHVPNKIQTSQVSLMQYPNEASLPTGISEGTTAYVTGVGLRVYNGTAWTAVGPTPVPTPTPLACGAGGTCSGGQSFSFKGLTYGTIVSPVTGKIWLDRNLGASQVCTSATDAACYGDYYQWGRPADGHEKRTSATTSTQATTITPGIASFITSSIDWTSADSDGGKRTVFLAKTDGTGVCPAGFHVPTEAELRVENITNSADAFTKFKIPLAGFRSNSTGAMFNVDSAAHLWSQAPSESSARRLTVHAGGSGWNDSNRARGHSIRCVQ